MEYIISAKGISKQYTGFKLDNVSFEIPEGAIVGFIGENGAGKSTTIKALLGLIQIDSGEVSIMGHQPKEADATWKEEVGVVFDENTFPSGLKTPQIDKMMKKIYQTWDTGKYQSYMQKFNLPDNKPIKDFSKGMKMKLAIAVALSHASRVLILDEATSGLDPIVRNEILDIFMEFMQDEHHAILLSSHITSDIEKIADYIMLIHKGKLLLNTNKDELIYNYGIVRCTKEQMLLIPEEIIVRVEKNAFENNVLVRDKHRLDNMGLVIDRASIEDILLYAVKGENI